VRVLIAGGGTAGHVFPGLAVAGVLRDQGHEVSFVGTEEGPEARLVPSAGFPLHPVQVRQLARKASPRAMGAVLSALVAARGCRPLVREADVAVGMGGYVSVPALLAARLERIPIVLHEQNAIPGLANWALSRVSNAVGLSFAHARRYFPRKVRTVVTGNPVRADILRVPAERDTLAKEGRRELDLDESRKAIVVFGGSQGALRLDRAAVGACRILSDRSDLQVVLITGPAHLGAVRRSISNGSQGREPIRVGGGDGILIRMVGYLERMELAFACADLVVSRAGATTVAEVSVCGLPALLVPYPHATGHHQEANARAVQRAGGASVMSDDRLSGESLAARIETLIDHQERLRAMSERAGALGRPDAAPALARLVTETASERKP
jgi:UDP-N-acetylglucosamine--N-acetylmuramyl-(pentapeptide) pyrophosphoryl-undecaprenol N-acetylglucosamine transferase